MYYDIFVSKFRKSKEAVLGRIVDSLDSEPGRILDVGCGTGLDSVFLGLDNLKTSIVGLDFSPQMLRRALKRTDRRGLKNIEYVLGERDRLPFQDSSFDAYVCLNGFTEGDNYYGVNQDITKRIIVGARLDDALKVLRVSGRMFLSLPMWNVEDCGEAYIKYEKNCWRDLARYSRFVDVNVSDIRIVNGDSKPYTCLFVSGRKE